MNDPEFKASSGLYALISGLVFGVLFAIGSSSEHFQWPWWGVLIAIVVWVILYQFVEAWLLRRYKRALNATPSKVIKS